MKKPYLLIAALLVSFASAHARILSEFRIDIGRHVCSDLCVKNEDCEKFGFHRMQIPVGAKSFHSFFPDCAFISDKDSRVFSIVATPISNLTPKECKTLFEEMTTIFTNDMGMTALGVLTETSRTFRSPQSKTTSVGPFSDSYISSVTSNYEIVDLTLRGSNKDQIVLQVTDNSANAKRPSVTLTRIVRAEKKSVANELLEKLRAITKSFSQAIETMAEDKILRWLLLGIIICLIHVSFALFRNLTREFPGMSTTKKILIVFVTLCTCCVAGMAIGRILTKKK